MAGSVCGRGGMSGRGHVWQEEVCVAGGYVWLGACIVGACMAGWACMAGRHAWQGGVRGRKNGNYSGRYASYWNAFLFNILLPHTHRTSIEIAESGYIAAELIRGIKRRTKFIYDQYTGVSANKPR